MKTLVTILLSLSLAACGSSGNNSNVPTQDNSPAENQAGQTDPTGMMPAPGNARFKLTFEASWSAADFPTQFPSNAHFSPLIGAMHNEQVVFWQTDGQDASDGIESMAESGSTSRLIREIDSAKANGYSEDALEGSGIGDGVGQTSIEFDTVADYPLLTLVSMIAPSPDWFIGVGGLSLLDDFGQWITTVEIPLKLYDAGTDLGVSFNSSNNDSSSQNLPVTLLSTDRADTDFLDGVHYSSVKTVGRFIIERIDQ